jgi:PAS domain S-box-containing protein
MHRFSISPRTQTVIRARADQPACARAQACFEDLLRTVGEFLLMVSAAGEIEGLCSSSQGQAESWSELFVGRRLERVFDRASLEQFAQWLDRAAKGERLETEYSIQREDEVHWFLAGLMPAARAGGRVATCIYAREITGWKIRESALTKSRALLRKAEEIGKMGSWEMNLETGEGIWSEQLFRLFGSEPQSCPMKAEDFLKLIHPDDRERLAKIPGLAPWKGRYPEHEARFILPDGRVRVFRTRAVPIADASGRVIRLVGLSEDVTERREVEQRLVRSEGLLAQAEQLANMGSWERELGTETLRWSAHYFRMVGLEPTTEAVPLGRGLAMIHPDDRERAVREMNALRMKNRPLDTVLRFNTAKGRERVFHSRAVLVRDSLGVPAYIRGMSQDITDRKREEDRLRKSEALLANAEKIANFGCWEYHYASGRATLSPHLLYIYGLESPEQWSVDEHWKRVHRKDRVRARKIVQRAMADGRPFAYMARYVRPNGRTRIFFVRGVPIVGASGEAEGSIGVVQDITDQRRAMQSLRRLSRQVMRARDEERRETARELHESAGQSLAALKMTLAQLGRSVEKNNPRAHKIWQACAELVNTAVREVRTVSYQMHPPLLDEAGIGPAVQWYARGFSERSGIDVRVEIVNEVGRQSTEIETTAFRIVQEALTNVYRHSSSRTALIRVMRRKEDLVVEIGDEGRGLALSASAGKRATLGVGITGMRERVEQLGGAFELDSVPGRGTTVRAILPLRRGDNDFSVAEETGGVNVKERRRARVAVLGCGHRSRA